VARLRELRDVPGIADALAALPVYRTYVEPWTGRVADADRQAIAAADMERAIAGALLLEERSPVLDEFVTRFQQTSPPVTAKGVEDTAFYRYLRLLALNEVGGDPARFGITVEEFHAANEQRAQRTPRGLLITQTHDTKRGGDVRARLGVLASMPGEWHASVSRWRALTEELRLRDGVDDRTPDFAEQYLIFQTLVGAWPIDAKRLEAYLEKALREAKLATSWVDQDHEHERRVQRYATGLLEHRAFLADFEPFAARIAELGRRSALAQQLLKLTSPGVADVYQGELEALNLVDPDNRRPVDWDLRRSSLAALKGGAEPDERTLKQFLIWKGLDLRARRAGAFAGVYDPIASGEGVCAYVRGAEVLTVVPVRDWDGSELALGPRLAGRWRDVLTGEEHTLAERQQVAPLMAAYGVALLERA
jgi:(1->4)-alpha-D-glucan 1-alpha-D-glucosylmutase